MSLIRNFLNNCGLHTNEQLEEATLAAFTRGESRGYRQGQEDGLRQAAQNMQHHIETREYVRLTRDMFETYRRQVLAGNSTLTENTSELQAGHMIGVNHALNILRDGFVIDATSAAKPV